MLTNEAILTKFEIVELCERMRDKAVNAWFRTKTANTKLNAIG